MKLFCLLELFFKRKRTKQVPVSLVKLVLELDPVQSERVQEALHHVHSQQHEQREREERREQQEHHQEVAALAQRHAAEQFVVEDVRELAVSKRQRPETQVRGSVGNSAERKLDSLD